MSNKRPGYSDYAVTFLQTIEQTVVIEAKTISEARAAVLAEDTTGFDVRFVLGEGKQTETKGRRAVTRIEKIVR